MVVKEANMVSTNSMMRFALALCVGVAITVSAAGAKDVPAALPDTYSKLIACKAITDQAARLDCFDKTSAALEQAIAQKEVLVTDKAQMKEVKRGLFGFSLPKLSLFGGDDEDKEAKEIEAVIARASQLGRKGPWVIYLEGGAKWVQIDGDIFPAPKPGQKIRLQKGAMGSYFGSVNGQRMVRMKREN
jgi:hypothetical protein